MNEYNYWHLIVDSIMQKNQLKNRVRNTWDFVQCAWFRHLVNQKRRKDLSLTMWFTRLTSGEIMPVWLVGALVSVC